ncbi:hypothetical protein O5O45_14580 [Hahella aquimaris]|uniref:hypothetical protein n=1 Tax=Hahella sp. HNIBRBA332 TaxID=3015983 RepID=UPI00273B23B9|nr:hypothetical protein [Hahella sp. HNIBRBA332]WLQ17144.1 hypothetical protein O5O45_14580 [Hahella sp. HNIBRBA332]
MGAGPLNFAPVDEFCRQLYLEHLEEASFLYNSYLAWRNDPEITWRDLQDLEDRLDAHIFALTSGGDAAKQTCLKHLSKADSGEIYAIARFFCQAHDGQCISLLWETLLKGIDDELEEESEEYDKVTAAARALRQDYPQEWRIKLAAILETTHHKLFPIIASAVAITRKMSDKGAKNLLENMPSPFLSSALENVAENHTTSHAKLLYPLLEHDSNAVRQLAAVGMLRLGETHVLPQLLNQPLVFAIPIALAGIRQQMQIVLQAINKKELNIDLIAALGISGDLRAVNFLLPALADDELAYHAAHALNLLVGANLYEEAFHEERFFEEDLFDHEIADFKNGKSPQHPGGRPYGENIEQLSRDPAKWRQWMLDNESRFDPALRYRYGEPACPQTIGRSLASPRTPDFLRRWIQYELCIRFGLGAPFSVENPVKQQYRQLSGIAQWVQEHGSAHTPGQW